jgi:inhibitor of KinA sporulation pathway (predicted exonuclease)
MVQICDRTIAEWLKNHEPQKLPIAKCVGMQWNREHEKDQINNEMFKALSKSYVVDIVKKFYSRIKVSLVLVIYEL